MYFATLFLTLVDNKPFSLDQTIAPLTSTLTRSDSDEFWNAVPHIDDADLIAAVDEAVEMYEATKASRGTTSVRTSHFHKLVGTHILSRKSPRQLCRYLLFQAHPTGVSLSHF